MRRGELYRVSNARAGDPRRNRIFLVVARRDLLESRYPAVACIPAYPAPARVATEVPLGEHEGLKHPSWLRCDDVTGVSRSKLTGYVGSLSGEKMKDVNRALAVALDIGGARLDRL
ncbi:MAG: type II toxin-antitoxin system PemK/MazF family toxin [Thermoflexaceae bacterium]|nr:type II toxin-antitoxin system PemK/MazF family toxin [Thermoflexaceae bacterium]